LSRAPFYLIAELYRPSPLSLPTVPCPFHSYRCPLLAPHNTTHTTAQNRGVAPFLFGVSMSNALCSTRYLKYLFVRVVNGSSEWEGGRVAATIIISSAGEERERGGGGSSGNDGGVMDDGGRRCSFSNILTTLVNPTKCKLRCEGRNYRELVEKSGGISERRW
jgi:hypothetical protein